MTTLLNEKTKINELKLNIGFYELDLEKFMDLDLSYKKNRNEMKIILNKISDLENQLSVFIESIKF